MLRDLSDCVHSQWHLYGTQGPGAVEKRTGGVRKCRLCQSASHSPVNCHRRFWNHTPTVQGATGPPRLCTQPVALVRCPRSRSHIEPYSGYTKMPFAPECSPRPGELAYGFSGIVYSTLSHYPTRDLLRRLGLLNQGVTIFTITINVLNTKIGSDWLIYWYRYLLFPAYSTGNCVGCTVKAMIQH